MQKIRFESFPQKEEKEKRTKKEKEEKYNKHQSNQSRLKIERKLYCLKQRLKIDSSNENFFYLAAYKLPLSTLERLAVTAQECGRNPEALFNYLARKEMGRG